MKYGFETIKDILDTLIIPFVLLIIGRLIVVWNKNQKEREFIKLIFRETEEMKPYSSKEENEMIWCEYLKKRFIHEETFLNSNSNLDFILSIDPELVYFESQLWINFKKAENTLKNYKQLIAEQKATDKKEFDKDMGCFAMEWIYYLEELCKLLKEKYSGNWFCVVIPLTKKVNNINIFDPYEEIYKPWKKIISASNLEEKKMKDKN